jgi:hypothetical protein
MADLQGHRLSARLERAKSAVARIQRETAVKRQELRRIGSSGGAVHQIPPVRILGIVVIKRPDHSEIAVA